MRENLDLPSRVRKLSGSLLAFFAVPILCLTSPLSAQEENIFVDGFESGDFSAWSYFFPLPAAQIVSSSPAQAETGVALSRETILEFTRELDPSTVASTAIYAEDGQVPVPATLHLSADQRRVTLFYESPLPDESTVRVFVEGDLLAGADGQSVDANGDGRPGGRWALSFSTQGLATLPGTRVCGRVLASEPALDGSDVPLEGVTISVDGVEQTYSASTDAMGNYCLDPAPSERFFVHIDGSTASNQVPEGAYYPTVGKAFEPDPGLTVHVGESFLPLIADGTLQAVSDVEDTTISLPDSVVADQPELAGSELVVPAGSLFFDDGTSGQSAGIAPVPSDRLPGNLPQDLEFPLVLTVQTDGATNFDVPAPICFPNLPQPTTGQPLPAGESQSLVSFDHDAGRWRAVGTMTVTATADRICSDLGTGITAPGWHLPSPPPIDPPPPPVPSPPPGPHPPHNEAPPTPDPPSDPPEEPDAPDQCPEGPALCADGCDAKVSLCGYSMLATGLSCGIIVAAATVPTAGLSLALTTSCGAVFGVLGIEGCGSVRTICESSCAARCGAGRSYYSKPLGSDPVLDDLALTVGEILALVEPYRFNAGGIPDGVRGQLVDLLQQADAQAGGDALGYLRAEGITSWPAVEEAMPAGNAPHYPILYLAEYKRDNEVLVQRGETGPYGQYTLFPPPAATLDRIRFYDPYTHSVGVQLATDLDDGSYGISRLFLGPVDDASFTDADGDTLADEIELVYGSNPTLPDTDGDGVNDRNEVIQGTDLLSRDIDIGEIVNGEITVAGELDRFRFAALAGQRVFLDLRDGATTRWDWWVVDSAGEVVIDEPYYGDAGTHELTRGGTYTLFIGDEGSTRTGLYEFKIWDVPPPDEFDIAIGDPVSVGVPGVGAGYIETPGREDIYYFEGTAGQRIFADLVSGGTTGWDWTLVAPNGLTVFHTPFYGDAGTFTLPVTGTYTLTLGEPDDDQVGTYSFRIWDVPPPDEFTISIGELVSDGVPGAGAGNIETPGREDIYYFEGTAGQRIFADLVSGRTTGWDWTLVAPNGLTVFHTLFYEDAGTFTLPVTGTYTLTLGEPDDDHVGTYSFRIWNVPPPDEFTISIGELVSDGLPGAGAGNIETPGREDIYYFQGTAGEEIFADLVSGGTTGWDWTLRAPNGLTVFHTYFYEDIGPYTLPVTGTYTLTIGEPDDDHVGTYSFRIE